MTGIVKAYADTSVYGGAFDKEFDRASISFFKKVTDGSIALYTSDVIRREMEQAPVQIRQFFEELLLRATVVEITKEMLELQQAYIKQGVLGKKSYDDALHIAIATVSGVDLIVSWNFKHIVNYRKIPLFNAVNTLKGYKPIAIHSPMEVVHAE